MPGRLLAHGQSLLPADAEEPPPDQFPAFAVAKDARATDSKAPTPVRLLMMLRPPVPDSVSRSGLPVGVDAMCPKGRTADL
jgi:hypothetical protein